MFGNVLRITYNLRNSGEISGNSHFSFPNPKECLLYIYNLETPREGDLLYFRAPLYFLVQSAVIFSQLYMAFLVLCAV